MARTGRLNVAYFKHRQKLMFADLEKCIALAFVELGQIEDVLIESDGLLNIVDFDREVIDAVYFDAHDSIRPLRNRNGYLRPGSGAALDDDRAVCPLNRAFCNRKA